MQKFDVIIVGAGPAGSFLAYKLKKQKVNVLILEKEAFPRYKTCAGGLSKKAYDLLLSENIDIEKVIKIPTKKTLYVRKQKLTKRISKKPLIYMTYRSELDYFLIEKAIDKKIVQFKDNVKILKINQQEKIIKYKINKNEFEVGYKILVGAWGNNIRLNSLVNLNPYKRFSISSSWEGTPSNKFKKHFNEFSLCQIIPGYPGAIGYIFPKSNKITAGVFTSIFPVDSDIKKLWSDFVDFWELESKIKPSYALIPVRDFKKPIAKDKVILVGDAAGLADPFTGEGIYYAFVSANIAKKHILNYLKNKYYELETLYNQDIHAELFSIYHWAKIYEFLFHHFTNISFWFGSECYVGNQIVNKFITGEIKYNEILKIFATVFKNIFNNR